MSLCEDCIKCVTHEGTPEGKWETINGIECYVGVPTGEYQKNKVLLFICDAFGPSLINNQLLVDDFAKHGIRAVAPDVFAKDPLPAEYETSEEKRKTFDIQVWFSGHTPEITRPAIDKVIDALKADGITEFAAIGYCYGGRHVFNLAFENITSLSIANHPSLLKLPVDLETYFSSSRAPLLLNTCTNDWQFPLEAQAQADAIFGEGKFSHGYRREYFDGCTHGFAVRGDLSVPKIKAGKEGAFKSSVEWLYQHGFGPQKAAL
ncbi:dienelactone hydrolase endo-1,3,1,4-beta-D-glucanase [Rhodocollybia butyracea]|uniref:Dienelactone hydrolase endo-1,3,1,4-beta-D-glucanase n=1 Tax=Rhodocollybia butyracea TaxID=206335 RepID=A0A9P5U0S3_9AGAR|nr:dienelactone hydrolase endo-1,3,1,4-beta-D-glucanase [Rhodocollybia butyracea]